MMYINKKADTLYLVQNLMFMVVLHNNEKKNISIVYQSMYNHNVNL